MPEGTQTAPTRDELELLLEGRLPRLSRADLHTVSKLVDVLLYNDPEVHPAGDDGGPLIDRSNPELRALILDHEYLVVRGVYDWETHTFTSKRGES